MTITTENRRLITREFAEVIDTKTPAPYFRLHDPVQRALIEAAARHQRHFHRLNPYFDRMIHFWREVSLSGMHRTGQRTDECYKILIPPPGATPKKCRSMDECYALLFESAFELGEAEPDWAAEALSQKGTSEAASLIRQLALEVPSYGGFNIFHGWIANGFTVLHAPQREWEEKWQNAALVALEGERWFWAGLLCSIKTEGSTLEWKFRRDLKRAAADSWGDARLHTRLIREAPQYAGIARRDELMAHPLLRIARLKYQPGSVEERLALAFLNTRCAVEGFKSEEDCFSSDLSLAQWVPDARAWAEQLRKKEAESCEAMFTAHGERSLHKICELFKRELGSNPSSIDDRDATAALIKWANGRRRPKITRYRAEHWEFIVDVTDAALWLGWLFPREMRRNGCRS